MINFCDYVLEPVVQICKWITLFIFPKWSFTMISGYRTESENVTWKTKHIVSYPWMYHALKELQQYLTKNNWRIVQRKVTTLRLFFYCKSNSSVVSQISYNQLVINIQVRKLEFCSEITFVSLNEK